MRKAGSGINQTLMAFSCQNQKLACRILRGRNWLPLSFAGFLDNAQHSVAFDSHHLLCALSLWEVALPVALEPTISAAPPLSYVLARYGRRTRAELRTLLPSLSFQRTSRSLCANTLPRWHHLRTNSVPYRS